MQRFMILLIVLAAVTLPTRAALSETLEGRVVDALEGRPVAGVGVSVEGLQAETITDGQGRYRLEVPRGTWRLSLSHPAYRPAGLANQQAPGGEHRASAHMYPRRVPADFTPGPLTFGVGQGTGIGPQPAGPERLPGSALLLEVPAELPQTIRVARYFSSSCSGSIQRIDELDFEDYVKGVVNAEIGVFTAVQGGPDSAVESFKTFSVAARSYALHFILTGAHSNYDINDTACNQRYDDARDPDVSAAVETTRGQILVKANDQNVIDRYFYAASCAHHGTEPAYRQGDIVSDPTSVRACVGSWCGHDNCAGHADNPDLPGDDRCLVWGICQWGSVERSIAGDSYVDILAHYQPECALRDFAGPATGILKGVVYENPELQNWITGATVQLEDEAAIVFDGENPWEFELEPGNYTVHAEAQGYLPGSVQRTVVAHETIWGSIGLDRAPEDGASDAGTDGGDEATSDAGAGASSDSGAQADEDGTGGGGCGCDTNGSATPVWILILLAGILFRRRA